MNARNPPGFDQVLVLVKIDQLWSAAVADPRDALGCVGLGLAGLVGR